MHVHLAEKTNWPPALGVLNPLIGTFQVTGQNDSWNIFYSLSALTKGRHFFQERILVQRGNNHYDGLQSYLLTKWQRWFISESIDIMRHTPLDERGFLKG